MRKISDTISRLAVMRRHNAAHLVPANDRLVDISGFGSNPGALRGRSYVPANLPSGAPLVVVLHGCTQSAAAYNHGTGWSTLADEQGFALLFPEQQRANNPNLCFNWFVPDDITRDSGELLSIRQMIDHMVSSHRIDRRRIFVTGLSAGGAMASTLLAAYPELFAGGAIIAGLPHGVATSVPEAFDRMRGHALPSARQLQALLATASSHSRPWPRISIWHGTADQTVAIANAEAIRAQWSAAHRLSEAPSRREIVDGHERRVWTGPDGEELLEIYGIDGMGHGTPLRTAGSGAVGNAGPFLLDVGISSTRRIAEFWNIAKPLENVDGAAGSNVGADAAAVDAKPENVHTGPLRRKQSAASATAERKAGKPVVGGTDVQEIIENALRSAGLMR